MRSSNERFHGISFEIDLIAQGDGRSDPSYTFAIAANSNPASWPLMGAASDPCGVAGPWSAVFLRTFIVSRMFDASMSENGRISLLKCCRVLPHRQVHRVVLLGSWLVILGACVRSLPSFEAGPNARPGSEVPAEILSELIRMGRLDQEVRQGLTPASMQDSTWVQAMARTDSVHTERLKEIVESYGWPDANRVGDDAARSAFLILQHGPDYEFKRAMLPVLEQAGVRGELPLQDVALLTDRILMHDGLPQRYGSQLSVEDGRLVVHPIEDERQVNARRFAMGLPTLDEYLDRMEEVYGMPVLHRPRSPQ